ncbi:MAG: hypothetical protein QG616_97 [Pseudomonadota bacterium]|jgi:hypothetical protein|nr:hypothetical protein [Pseudomonadota bacterium]MDQ5880268.1 hypothetical protein [Pseudomonadota bacterium]MDQ5903602.1 hypothetical protein [Pseudomonadota bacterium]MDQ5914990.1 hypothetical protein [Pseudomonadota bacterium]MDQ5918789.1 hypothetical protein [Pseudomonadota bacterium]
MRRLLLLLAFVASTALAQTSKPADLQPLPAIPPPPPEIVPFDSALEPQVTIRKRDGDTIEEYRRDGRMYMIKVTPPHGVPYYLVDTQGDGNFSRMETLDDRTRVPMWIIKTF